MKTNLRTRHSNSPAILIQSNHSGQCIIILNDDGNIYRAITDYNDIINLSGLVKTDEFETEISEQTQRLIDNFISSYNREQSSLIKLDTVQQTQLATRCGRISDYPLYKLNEEEYYLSKYLLEEKKKNVNLTIEKSKLEQRLFKLNLYITIHQQPYLGSNVDTIIINWEKKLAKDKIKTEKENKKKQEITAKLAQKAKNKLIKQIRKTLKDKTATIYNAEWLEYPVGNRAYGGGGWSKRAKYRPAPEKKSIITYDVIMTEGSAIFVQGQKKLKLNLYNYETGECLRNDYGTITV